MGLSYRNVQWRTLRCSYLVSVVAIPVTFDRWLRRLRNETVLRAESYAYVADLIVVQL
jgi:hypothetical protein